MGRRTASTSRMVYLTSVHVEYRLGRGGDAHEGNHDAEEVDSST